MTEPACSFCGRSHVRLVAGPTPNLYICDECVEMCTDILKAQDDEKASSTDAAPKDR